MLYKKFYVSKFLKEALFLFFFLFFFAWNQKQIMFLMEQKMFANKICSKSNKTIYQRNKKCSWKSCSKWKHHCFISFLSLFTALCGLLQISMVLYGLLMVFYSILWPLLWSCLAFYGLVLYGRSIYSLLWPFMAIFLFEWTFVVFSRGHRYKFIWSCLNLIPRQGEQQEQRSFF